MLAFVVDDSRAMRSIMKGILKDLNFDTLDAVDGKDALRVLASAPRPDVMLIDWNMPEMNGFELMLAVRDNPAYKDVPLLMVTTENEMDMVVKALEAGANEYIMKPFDREIVREKLQILGLKVD